MRKRCLNLSALVAAAVLVSGCPRDRAPDEARMPPDTVPAGDVTGWSPEAQMRATLSDLVHAQMRHHEEHGIYSDDPSLLIERYDFVPVGDATVAITFAGTTPEWGYLGAAIHPLTDQRCRIHHGRASEDGAEFAGEIECDAV